MKQLSLSAAIKKARDVYMRTYPQDKFAFQVRLQECTPFFERIHSHDLLSAEYDTADLLVISLSFWSMDDEERILEILEQAVSGVIVPDGVEVDPSDSLNISHSFEFFQKQYGKELGYLYVIECIYKSLGEGISLNKAFNTLRDAVNREARKGESSCLRTNKIFALAKVLGFSNVEGEDLSLNGSRCKGINLEGIYLN